MMVMMVLLFAVADDDGDVCVVGERGQIVRGD